MDIKVYKQDNVHVYIDAEPGICYELNEYFSYYMPGHKFHPKVKAKIWDGKIRLFSLKTRRIYFGLIHRLIEFAKKYGYSIALDESLRIISDIAYDESIISECAYTPRDYQEEAIKYALEHKRCILESPTGSGKSYIIYQIIRHIAKKTLVIVPTVGLVHQMRSDFIDYNPDVEGMIYGITAGVGKESDCPIFISTWQSIYKMPKEWFDQFEVVIGDECHGYKATSLISIMEKCTDVEWRIGTTGTVSNKNSLVNVLTLEGLFGKVKKVASTKELMDQNYLTNIKIKGLVLKHNDKDARKVRQMSYANEMDFIVTHEKRNKFISKLALAQEKNTLVLFQYVEKHGKVLYDMMNDMNTAGKNIYYVAGSVSGDEREEIRNLAEKDKGCIICASFGTFSTGINIRNIHSIVFASSYKSRIKNLQSIGRGLRLHDDKDFVILYDIIDDCSTKSKKNFSVKHFLERAEIYTEEKFDFKIHNINL